MPRKNNKTEQVLRLITKRDERDEQYTEPEDRAPGEPVEETAQIEETLPDVLEPEEITEEREFAPEPVQTAPVEPAGSTEMRQDIKEQLKEELMDELREQLKEERAAMAAKEAEPITISGPSKVCEPLNIGTHQVPPPTARTHDLEIVNLSEVLAYELMGETMRKMNVCDCKICQADVLAMTLNYLPQKYVATDSGRAEMQLDLYKKQHETDMLSALTRACVRVKGSPRHN